LKSPIFSWDALLLRAAVQDLAGPQWVRRIALRDAAFRWPNVLSGGISGISRLPPSYASIRLVIAATARSRLAHGGRGKMTVGEDEGLLSSIFSKTSSI
jgi:hypothetical protein